TFFLADEYQALATSSNSDGLSDASVWNVLRSAGIGGIVLSQSVSAYRLAVGDAATENMRRNWRTKIILRTEDLDTIDEAKKLAGRTMRFHSMDWNQLESAAAARRETGVSADALQPVQWTNEIAVASAMG
ncbi:TraM recognition domain-containing protein, partial [Salmonella enterica]|uniref:TraM recognition domain-containing protein n=2 Tax=Pseudomonadati TaxID=3379134 RepID=UPI003526CE19